MNEVLVYGSQEIPLIPGSVRQKSVDGRIPVEFAGCSGEGELYEDRLGRVYLLRYTEDIDLDHLAETGEPSILTVVDVARG